MIKDRPNNFKYVNIFFQTMINFRLGVSDIMRTVIGCMDVCKISKMTLLFWVSPLVFLIIGN